MRKPMKLTSLLSPRTICLLCLLPLLFSSLGSSEPSGCGGSDEPWQSQGVTDSAYLHSVAIGSIYATGVGQDQKARLWSLNNGVWTPETVIGPIPATAYRTVYRDGKLTIGSYTSQAGNVTIYDPSTKRLTDLNFNKSKTIRDLTYWNDNIIAAGHNKTDSGQVWRYTGGVWNSLGVRNMSSVDALAVSGGKLFIGGANETSGGDPRYFGTVRSYDGATWTNIPPPAKVNGIWVMVSDNQGGVYVGGWDDDFKGQVWHCSGAVWTNLDLPDAANVYDLEWGSSGELYAAGQNSVRLGQVWKRAGSQWKALGIMHDSSVVYDLGFQADGSIVAVGLDRVGNGQMWIYD